MNDKVQNGEVIIDIKDLSKAFGDLKVLTNISTQIRKGDVVCVIGPSGSGKSTFLRCMNLLETPTGGHIYFEGTDITDPKTSIDKLRHKMGMVFQQFNLFPHMTILDNMTLAPMKLLGRPKDEAETEALKLLERVGLITFLWEFSTVFLSDCPDRLLYFLSEKPPFGSMYAIRLFSIVLHPFCPDYHYPLPDGTGL